MDPRRGGNPHPWRILPIDFRCPSHLKFLGPCAPRHRLPLALVGGKDGLIISGGHTEALELRLGGHRRSSRGWPAAFTLALVSRILWLHSPLTAPVCCLPRFDRKFTSCNAGTIEHGFGTPVDGPTLVGTDSLSHEQVINRLAGSNRSKPFIKQYVISLQRIASEQITVGHISDIHMPSDFLTKWIGSRKLRLSLAYATNSAAFVPRPSKASK